MSKASIIDRKDFNRLISCVEKSDLMLSRNVALLYVLYGTGMMLTEIATIKIAQYLKPNGEVLEESWIPKEISYNQKERPIYWTNKKIISSIDSYLASRITNLQLATTIKNEYRGLNPESPIFLSSYGFPYALTERITRKGTRSYSCDSLSQLFRQLHAKANIEDANSQSGRRTFAVRLYQSGYDLRLIKKLLGHDTQAATRKLIGDVPINFPQILANIV